MHTTKATKEADIKSETKIHNVLGILGVGDSLHAGNPMRIYYRTDI